MTNTFQAVAMLCGLFCNMSFVRTGKWLRSTNIPLDPERGERKKDFARAMLVDSVDSSKISQQKIAHNNGVERNQVWTAGPHILENECRIPVLSPDEPELIPFTDHFRTITCPATDFNLVTMDRYGYIYVHRDTNKAKSKLLPKFECYYRGLTGSLYPKITQYQISSGHVKLPKNSAFFVPEDQFIVRCYNLSRNSGNKFDGSLVFHQTYAHFPDKQDKVFTASSPDQLSLSILVMDSTSLNQFRRHMPLTVEYMQKLGFQFLEGYNKVADNSMVNLMPVLAGIVYTNLSSTITSDILPQNYSTKRVKLEDYRYLWDDMKDRGCVTMLNDDIGNTARGLFHYPWEQVKGFERPPTDYYFRPYQVYNYKELIKNGSEQCVNDKSGAELYLDMWEQFSMRHRNVCHFSFNFLTTLTHDSPSLIETVDERIRTTLERFVANRITHNTVLVIMGDHGNRINTIRQSYAGRIEERMPLFSILLPNHFQQTYPNLMENLRTNTNRLTSNFDVHQTLKDLTTNRVVINQKGVVERSGRGISLFDQIPTDRTCEQASIPENFCACMERRRSAVKDGSEKYTAIIDTFAGWFKEQNLENCLDFETLSFDEVVPFSITQMVRHGLRDMRRESLDMLQATAAMEILYFELHGSIQKTGSSNDTRLEFQSRIKEYVFKEQYYMNVPPMLKNAESLCSKNSSAFNCTQALTFAQISARSVNANIPFYDGPTPDRANTKASFASRKKQKASRMDYKFFN